MTAGWVRRHDEYAQVGFPYSAPVVAELKSTVPGAKRGWDKGKREWRIDEPFVARAIAILRRSFPDVEIADMRKVTPARTIRVSVDWAESLWDALPDHLREPAFKALHKVLHPDLGGDLRMAQRLNDAFRRQKAS